MVDELKEKSENLKAEFQKEIDQIAIYLNTNGWEKDKELIDLTEEENPSLDDYFNQTALDSELRIGADLKYRSVSVLLTYGGPNIYINTNTGLVSGYWAGMEVSAIINDKSVEQIDDVFENYYESVRTN